MPTSSIPSRPALALGFGTLLSRLLGFGRDLLFGHLLGASADAFLVAFRLPDLGRRLLAEGVLGLPFMAAAARVFARSGHAGVTDLWRAVLAKLIFLALPLSLGLMLFAGPVFFMLAPGLPEAAQKNGVNLLRICSLYVPCCLIAAMSCARLAQAGSFRPQATTSALFNALLIATCLLALALPETIGPGRLVRTDILLCLGVLAAGAGQATAGLYGVFRLVRKGESRSKAVSLLECLKPGQRCGPPEATALLRALPRCVPGAAPHLLHILAATLPASFLAGGGVSALYFAGRLVELPLGLFGAAIGTAAMPSLVTLAAEGKNEEFNKILGRGLRLGAFLSLPAAAGLFALAQPICALLFGHGAYDEAAVAVTATVLSGYCFALPAQCASRMLLSAIGALRSDGATMRCALLSLFPLALLSLVGLLFLGGDTPGAPLCLGLGLAGSAWLNLALLHRLLTRAGFASPLAGHYARLGGYFAASFCMAVAIMFLESQSGPFSALSLSLIIILCAGVWGGFAFLAKR